MTPDDFETRVRHIADADVLAAVGFDSFEQWARHWAAVAPGRARFVDREMFLGTRDEVVARVRPDSDAVLAAAGRVLRHDIQGWGDATIRHGPVVDFNAEYGQSGKYGFHYFFWSQPLIHAHLLTGDDKYLVEFDRLFNRWYEQRDAVRGGWPHLDVIWYELGLGNRNRTFLESYFLPLDARPLVTHERMLKTLLGAARWLYDEQLKGYREGNWQIMGAYGLVFIATMVPEFKESPDWLRVGLQRLREHADRDFFADGCHSERVPSSYMVVAYRDQRNLVTLLEGRDDAAPFKSTLARMLDWFMATLPPDHILPGINDGQRAPLPRLLLADAAALGKHPADRSVHLPASGFTALRSGADCDARYMLINHGGYGGGHTHADCLSFQCHAFGRPLAIDSGIGPTYDDPLYLTWYMRSVAHNLVTVDGEDLDRKAATGEDVVFTPGPDVESLAATHRGYEASKGVIHRRHIAFVRREYWIVYDVVELRGDARTVAWELHRPGPGLLALHVGEGWEQRTRKGRASVLGIPGHAGTHAEIEWLRWERRSPGHSTATIGVLLYPFHAAAPSVRFTGDAGRFIVEHGRRQDHVTFGPTGVTYRDAGPGRT